MDPIDTTEALTAIALLAPAVVAIGSAKLGVNGLVFVWRKVQGIVSR